MLSERLMGTLLLATLLAVSGQPATSTLEVYVDGLRNTRGFIRACLMQDRGKFPNCNADTSAIAATVAASSGRVTFAHVKPGIYAVTLFHDENANARLDTVLGIPKEGFGFSRNPVVRFGAPRYDKVSIELAPGYTRVRIRLQYLL